MGLGKGRERARSGVPDLFDPASTVEILRGSGEYHSKMVAKGGRAKHDASLLSVQENHRREIKERKEEREGRI